MIDVKNAWIETYTGLRFHLLDPKVEEVCIEDISHALSNQARFTGHTYSFYSVAQHSVIISHLVPKEDAFWGLMHDAAEAYVADLSKPLKFYTAIGPVFKEIEERIMAVIVDKFRLGAKPHSVSEFDTKMRYTEKEQLLKGNQSWDGKWTDNCGTVDIEIHPMYPMEAKKVFVDRYHDLLEVA